METADRLTPLVDVATLHNQLPSPLERVHFFLTKTNIQIYIRSFFFLYLLKRKEKEKEREKKKEERKAGKRRIKRLFGAKTLRAEFPTQNFYLFLYAFFLTDKRKTIF